MHKHDELYHGQRGPAENIHILLTAYSDPAGGGTGKNEPIVWWSALRQRQGGDQPHGTRHAGDLDCMQCVGFKVLIQPGLRVAGERQVQHAHPTKLPYRGEAEHGTVSWVELSNLGVVCVNMKNLALRGIVCLALSIMNSGITVVPVGRRTSQPPRLSCRRTARCCRFRSPSTRIASCSTCGMPRRRRGLRFALPAALPTC